MYRFRVLVNEVGAEISALGPEELPCGFSSWSLQSLRTQQDVHQVGVAIVIRNVLRKLGVHRAYAPHVIPASAQIIDTCVLNEHINIGENIALRRNRSIPGDGIPLEKGYAVLMGLAGCSVIIATDGDGDMIVAHAGRDSLVDPGAINGEPTRKHVSIVDAIVESFLNRGATLDRIVMCMQLAIPASAFERQFDHPIHGNYNREFGNLSVHDGHRDVPGKTETLC